MRVPLSWLGEFVAVEADVAEVARRLTLAGLEVEAQERLIPAFSNVRIARVTKVERHPNADRLSVCQVDAGAAGRFSVVCGAPNVRGGMTGALATVGATLAGSKAGRSGPDGAIQVEAAIIRGVRSEGMLCSEAELGLSQDHSGILELEPSATPGKDFADYIHADDWLLDIAITPNRGDCLSILGIAREVAALFNARLRQPRLRPLLPRPNHDGSDSEPAFEGVRLDAPALCPRYVALPIGGVKIRPSPLWLTRRLELCGTRPVNNAVDVTNYVMLELGQPLHAFDLERLAGRRIVVRLAGEEHSFVSLDGVTRQFEPSDLVIADAERAVAIAGVMGGISSEVSETTRTILLESAYFEPTTVTRTSRRLDLRSEASYRFERGVDRDGQIQATVRAADLMRQLSGGRALSQPVDVRAGDFTGREIKLEPGKIGSLLGVTLPAREVRRRLKALGAAVRSAEKGRLRVLPPSFRSDLRDPADLAEEVARLTGLSDIPAQLPARRFSSSENPEDHALLTFLAKVREVMVGCGLSEAKTLSLVHHEENEQFPGLEPGRSVRLDNPISVEFGEMRRSLIPGLLQALRFNLYRQASAFHVFELGRVFSLQGAAPTEREKVGGLSYGQFALSTVGSPGIQSSFWTVKGVIEALCRALGQPSGLEFSPPSQGTLPFLHPGRAAQITLGGSPAGYLGELHPRQTMRLELAVSCTVFELDIAQLLTYGSTPRRPVEAPAKFPAVRRDLALVVDAEVPAGQIVRTLEAVDPTLTESVEIFDVFEGGSVPTGKKSVAVACRYRAKDRTLTDVEVNGVHARLVEAARTQLGAELRQ